MNNQSRTEAVYRTLIVYNQYKGNDTTINFPDETIITDLLADLYHLADEYAVDINQCFRMAEIHYNSEKE